jgi:hypothetical protein
MNGTSLNARAPALSACSFTQTPINGVACCGVKAVPWPLAVVTANTSRIAAMSNGWFNIVRTPF